MKKEYKYIYINLITKKYYTGYYNNDSNNINNAKKFDEHSFLFNIHGKSEYERKLFEDAIKKDKFTKLKNIYEINKF